MNVLDIIKGEHREVAALIDRSEACDPGDPALRELADEIKERLTQHLAIEERLFYARLRECAEERDERVDVFEAYTEHAVAKSIMQMLESDRTSDEGFKAELLVLGESVKQHVKEEESTIFSLARSYLGSDELDEIGADWEASKHRSETRNATGGAKAERGTTRTSRRKEATRL